MKTMIFVFLAIVIAFILLLTFALCRAAAEGDRQAEELYLQWMEEHGDGREESSTEAVL